MKRTRSYDTPGNILETMSGVIHWRRFHRISWSVGLLYYLSGVVSVCGRCPDSWSSLVERCIEDNMPPHMGDDQVQVTYEYWMVTCRHYKDAFNCVNNEVQDCQESGGSIAGSESILEKLQMDHTNICGSNDTLERFQTHSACFEQVENETLACQNNYMKDYIYQYVYYDTRYEYEYVEEEYDDATKDMEKLCESMQTLLKCINRAVLSRCGDDAMDLYDRMILSQIPSHVAETCSEIVASSGLSTLYDSHLFVICITIIRIVLLKFL